MLYADLDYDSMQYAMNGLKDRRGVEVIKIALPEPATRQGLLDAYEAAFEANPKPSFCCSPISATAPASSCRSPRSPAWPAPRASTPSSTPPIPGARSSSDVRELGVDFVGFNLHKWIGAPVGVGFLYIRKDRLADIDRDMGDEDFAGDRYPLAGAHRHGQFRDGADGARRLALHSRSAPRQSKRACAICATIG